MAPSMFIVTRLIIDIMIGAGLITHFWVNHCNLPLNDISDNVKRGNIFVLPKKLVWPLIQGVWALTKYAIGNIKESNPLNVKIELQNKLSMQAWKNRQDSELPRATPFFFGVARQPSGQRRATGQWDFEIGVFGFILLQTRPRYHI